MRRPSKFRYLASKEKQIARSVFKDSLPYSKVVVSNGLGYDDRPFTVPEALGGKYILHVGDGYYGMSLHQSDKALLIHELTHVWQGEHSSWRWSYVFKSGWHQATGDAYSYDKKNLKSWTSYNPEQQAQIVEDWFKDGMKETDPRYPFIRIWIRGNNTLNIKLPDPPVERLTHVTFKPHEEPRRIPSDILFGFDSARLKQQANKYLKKAGETLNTYANGRTVLIEGHTDSVGHHGYNMTLSERRARAVKKKLVELGVDNANRFETKGYGETRPLVPNDSPQNRQRNRRVEFRYK